MEPTEKAVQMIHVTLFETEIAIILCNKIRSYNLNVKYIVVIIIKITLLLKEFEIVFYFIYSCIVDVFLNLRVC